MTCPHCGAGTPGTHGRCTVCGQSVVTLPSVVTGVLTPPPGPADVSQPPDDTTGYPDLGVTRPPRDDLDVTGVNPPGPATSDDATFLPSANTSSQATGPLTIGQRFGPRYQIIRMLGVGGMGAVYQAWDAELDVVVAVKVIRPEASTDANETRAIERRFKQELLLARQVTHKNVVRIHDLGEIDGIKYITMSYIDGRDLATVLKEAGKLPVPMALKIMRQVASGLSAAHDAGVVHRDLKPANIMVEGEQAIIMDFGIARSAAAPAAAAPATGQGVPDTLRRRQAAAHHTVAGTIVGTIAYMAPEQARGEAVDQRADIYALGLIMLDMVLGRRVRGSQQSAIEELQRRMNAAPPPLRSIDPKIPEAIERIVARCVAPDPAARFQTTAELVAELDRLDSNGNPLPLVRRLTPRMMAAAAVVVVAMLAGTYFATRRALEPPKLHDPVSVMIADFQNNTNDAAFDRTLEPMLKRALEGAAFISAYDRNAIVRLLGERPPARLDESAARELALKQGLGVVLAGTIDRQGDGFDVAVKAVQTVTGEVIADERRRAPSKDQVLEVATNLVARVRNALGDETSEREQMFAMTTLSATSLDVVRHYVAAQEAAMNNKFEDARQSALKAVELDPKFGIGYQLLSVASRNTGRVQDAQKYLDQALTLLDSMTERERYSVRGLYYRSSGDYKKCVEEYGALVDRYAADVVAHNQRALCLSNLRRVGEAVDEIQQIVNLLPNRLIFRANLALYTNYHGDFATAEQEARKVGEGDAHGLLALAFSQLGQGQIAEARETYRKQAAISRLGAFFSSSGLGDAAILEGRFSDAVGILEQAAAEELAANNADRAAAKFAKLAYAELLRGRNRAAVEAANKALANSQTVKIRFLAGRALIEAGDLERARPVIQKMAAELQADPQAHAKILEGELALKTGNARAAIKLLTEANELLDTWMGHFILGKAYLEAGAFIEADSEFDRCIKRQGEALSLFLDEEPTYGYFPAVYYYQGRVREALKNARFAESYRTYLSFRGDSKEDPLLPEIRKRIGNQP